MWGLIDQAVAQRRAVDGEQCQYSATCFHVQPRWRCSLMRWLLDLLKCQIRSSGSSSSASSQTAVVVIMGVNTRWARGAAPHGSIMAPDRVESKPFPPRKQSETTTALCWRQPAACPAVPATQAVPGTARYKCRRCVQIVRTASPGNPVDTVQFVDQSWFYLTPSQVK